MHPIYTAPMRIYGYLRASTDEQDATRAKVALEQFVHDKGKAVSGWFIENESGATLKRPELFKLVEIAQRGDILLVEQIDRISRLNAKDWESLKATLSAKGIVIVSLDLPTSHQCITASTDEFTQRVIFAVNGMLLDVLAASARKDYEDRNRRRKEGIQKAQAAGKYKGRRINKALHENIAALLRDGKSYTNIQSILGCSRHTISTVKKKMNAAQEGAA